MALDTRILEQAVAARDRMDTAQDGVERARGDYHRAIRRLHAAGGTLREIAEALGLSHQRVHQLVDSGSMIEPESPSRARTDLIHCTFCNTSQKETRKLIAGPGVYICEVCVGTAMSVGAGKTGTRPRARFVAVQQDATRGLVKCSFCGKSRKKVSWIVEPALADVRICDECVHLCVEILVEEGDGPPVA